MPNYLDTLDRLAKEYGVPAEELRAIYQMETGSGRNVGPSSAGARGQMQLMPGTARDMGVTDINDPMQNLRGGAKYYAQQRQHFGDPILAAAAYNAGPGRVQHAGGVPNIAETKNYVAGFRKLLGATAPVTNAAPSATTAGSIGTHTVDEDTTDLNDAEGTGLGALAAPFKALDTERMSLAFNRAQQFADAKKRIEQTYAAPDRGDLFGALSRAFLSPTPYRGFAGVMHNVSNALGGFSAEAKAAQQAREQALAQLQQSYAADTNKEVSNALNMKYRALTAKALADAKVGKRRTGFNPVTGQLQDMDTGEPIEGPEVPVLTPEMVAALSRDPRNRGMRFKTTDGREMRIR